jgi:hypothetical protein
MVLSLLVTQKIWKRGTYMKKPYAKRFIIRTMTLSLIGGGGLLMNTINASAATSVAPQST